MKVIFEGLEYVPFGDKFCVRPVDSTGDWEERIMSAIPETVQEQLATGVSHNFDNPAVLGIPGARIIRHAVPKQDRGRIGAIYAKLSGKS